MSLIGRLKRRYRDPAADAPEPPQASAYSLRLPNPLGGEPLCRATIALTSTRHAEGETVRLQAHLDGLLTAPKAQPAPALEQQQDRRGVVAAGRGLARSLAGHGLARLPLANRRLQTWIDIQASTAPLARGADALIPARLSAFCGGSLPRQGPGEPRVGIWRGPAGGSANAQLALLQIDGEDFPAGYRGAPMSMAVSVATLAEDSAGEPPRR